MSTCIDTANRDENYSGYEPPRHTEYIATIIEKCLYCSHLPFGTNQHCSMELHDQLYCLANNHCYFIKKNDVAIYVSNVKLEEFIEEQDFEV